MTNFNNLGWECPVCHCGNAPTASWCWNCVDQKRPRPTGEPITCAFCKGLIYPGESHLCKTWEKIQRDQEMANKGTKICHRCQKEVVVGLVHDCRLPANTVAPPTYDGKFTPPHQVVNTSRVFTVCPACTHEVVVGQPHNCPNTGSPVK